MKILFTCSLFYQLLLISSIISFSLVDVIASEDDDNNNNSSDSSFSNNETNNDIDNDGLTNIEEQNIYKTEAFDEDTDNDGLTDGKEVKGWLWAAIESQGFCNNISTNEDDEDNNISPSDNYDLEKVCIIQKTNPLLPDTDKDSNDDFFEYNFLLANANDNDQDKDALVDGLEYGANAKYNTSFLKYDTDGDDISDGQEVQLGTNPLDPTHSSTSPKLSQIPPRSSSINPPLVRPPHFLEEVKGNEPPRVFSQTITISKNRPIEIFLFATDPDGQDRISFYIRSNPLLGQFGSQLLYIDRNTAKVLYTPTQNAVGKDVFTFWAFDGKEFSRDRGIITLNILP